MANVTRVKVTLDDVKGNRRSRDDNYKLFRQMFGLFKRQVTEAGIITLWKQKQFHETRGEKRRRKRKEALLQRMKDEAKQGGRRR